MLEELDDQQEYSFYIGKRLVKGHIYIEEKECWYVPSAIILLAAFFEPELRLFFPVFLYDLAYHRKYVFTAPFLMLFAVRPSDRAGESALWFCTAALSVVLAYKTEKKQFLAKELIRIRDSGEELNLMLKEKNQSLLEKQDYEIYLATLKERNRIAREIHDNVGHMLSRSILMTGALLTVEKEGGVHEQLLMLERLGKINVEKGKTRAIRLEGYKFVKVT